MLEKCIARARNAEIYSWENDQVLKLFYDFIPVEAIDGEYTKTLTISRMTEMCPSIYDRITLEEGEGITFENIKGKSLTYNLLNNPLRLKEFSTIMAESHKRIHKIIANELPEINAAISFKIKDSKILNMNQKSKLVEILDSMPKMDRLCHMNFHPDSIFITDQGTKVIDWMNAGKGNPLVDVAKTLVLLRFSSLPFQNVLFRGVAKLSKEILIRDYLNEYFKGHEYPNEELDKWILIVAASRTNEKLPESELNKLDVFIQEEL
ncbi:phosphotransferase [Gudongella sp. DL1XJH-153]|uniref:phosphotransferase n=1 Tax=Gudongella sp. DL1XJH-153 TaxID=3409804 RepID=UPI003BB52F59